MVGLGVILGKGEAMSIETIINLVILAVTLLLEIVRLLQSRVKTKRKQKSSSVELEIKFKRK